MAKSKLRQLVRFPWAADSFPWVGKLRTVLPFTNRDVTRDSAVLNLNRGQVLRFATCLTAGRVGSAVQWVVRGEPARVDTSRAVGCPRRHRSGSHVARGARLAAPRHHCDHPRRRWVRLYPGARGLYRIGKWPIKRHLLEQGGSRASLAGRRYELAGCTPPGARWRAAGRLSCGSLARRGAR
jgi:hypothetical protein